MNSDNSKDYKDYVEEIDLQRYWLVLKRQWLPALLIPAVCLSGALVWLLLSSQEAIYQATGKLLLVVDRSTYLTGVGQEIGELQTVGRSDPLQNQAIIVESSSVLEQVIQSLDLKDEDGYPLSVDGLRDNFDVDRQNDTDVLIVAYESSDPQLSAKVVNEAMKTYVKYNIALNRSEATVARKFVQQEIPQAKAELDQHSEALRQFQLQYQIVDLDSESKAAMGLVANLDQQITTLSSQLAQLNTQAYEQQQQLGMSVTQARQMELLGSSSVVQDTLKELLTVQTALESERSQYTTNFPTVRDLEEKEAALKTLLTQRIKAVLQQNNLTSGAPQITLGNLQISELDRQLMTQLVGTESNRLSLASQIASLQAQRQEIYQRLGNIPTLTKQQRELQQRVTIAENNYLKLLERRQESLLAENQVLGSAEIIERAQVPLMPIASEQSRLKYLLAAGVGGVFLGVATAFFLDLIDRSIKTVKDGEALLEYPIRGVIPHFKLEKSQDWQILAEKQKGIPSSRIITLAQPQSVAAAAYQRLYGNLQLIHAEPFHAEPLQRRLVVTSAVDQEGKSEVCANLAVIMAQTGKRTVLVDANLRSPTQHLLWNVDNEIGLSHLLLGKADLSEAVTVLDDNLALIPAGAIPMNPLTFIDSDGMEQLLKLLLTQYDYVLLDTPSLRTATDGVMIGKLSDGILWVLQPRKADMSSALSAKSLLVRSGTKILGIVANNVNIQDEHEDHVSNLQ